MNKALIKKLEALAEDLGSDSLFEDDAKLIRDAIAALEEQEYYRCLVCGTKWKQELPQ